MGILATVGLTGTIIRGIISRRRKGAALVSSTIVESLAVVGATTAAEGDADVALFAGLTYGGLMAIMRGIMMIVDAIRKARANRG